MNWKSKGYRKTAEGKRRSKNKNRHTVATSVRAASVTWKIITVDNATIREGALKAYLRAERAVEKKRADLDRFEAGDLPAFHRWEAATFGPLMAEIREFEAQAEGKMRILAAIDDEVVWTGCSRVTAYRRVMEAMNAPEEENSVDDEDGEVDDEPPPIDGEGLFGESDLPPGFDIDDFDRLPEAVKADFRAFFQSVAATYEMLTGDGAPDLDDLLERARASRRGTATDASHSGPPRRDIPSAARQEDRVKTLYRQLVRKLHPDANGNLSAREQEIWHEVQDAYKTRDIERLEAAAGRVEFGLNGASLAAPVSLLLRMTRDLSEALRGLTRQINRARRHVAWGFAKSSIDLRPLEKRLRRQLEARKRDASDRLIHLAAILDDLARRAAQRAPKRHRHPKRKAESSPDEQLRFW